MSIDTPNPSDMRIVYDKDQLTEADLASNPLDQFTKWLADAVAEHGVAEFGDVLAEVLVGGLVGGVLFLVKRQKDG